VATATETAQMDADALAAQLNAAAAPPAIVAAPQHPEDPLDRLSKLAELHAAGALTDEEFQAQKAKILEQT
jgi:putative oligomerization/nucleic acid binding protein